jgi:hypothetical protein
MANVKKDDLAIIFSSNEYFNGKICEIIKRAPCEDFYLPDGHMHIGGNKRKDIFWVVKFPYLVKIKAIDGSSRMSNYAVGNDKCLRKISGPDVDIHEEQSITEKS